MSIYSARPVRWLASLPTGVILLISVGGAAAFAVATTVLLHRIIRGDGREHAGLTAAAYMTALGSLFAILTGFLLNGEYAVLRQTQNLVYEEVAAGSRLAYSTEGLPAADISLIQDALSGYFGTLGTSEWRALERGTPAASAAIPSLARLQQVVFDISSRGYTPSATADGMQTAVADLTGIRRQRVAVSSQSTPVALFVLSLITGVALIVNAILVTLRSGRGFALVAVGIIVIVALDLAAIIGISAPFNGPFQASPDPVVQLAQELRSGQYLPWLAAGR